MKHRQSGETNDFRGIITDIEVVGKDGDQGQVVLKGGSPTLLLDRDPSMAVFIDNTLAGIISETIDGYGLTFELENKPKFETTIPYAARYKETGYSFLSRLAASCGDWFYYNGKKLVVGNPQNDETRRVSYDVEIKSITTRSGHTIEFDDTEGEEKIHIRDNGGSVITFDTKEKSLFISSNEDLNLSAKNINIAAEENISIGAKKDISISAEGNMQALSKGDMAIQSDGDTSVSSQGNLEMEATSDASLSGLKALIKGETNAELNAAQIKVAGSAMAEFSGSIVKLN